MTSQIFRVVFEDESLLIVEKLQPFLSQPSDEGGKEGFYELIARALDCKVYPVHRLDREVLGLMVFGKTQSAADHLSEQFRARSIAKRYEATVRGRVHKDRDQLVHFLAKNSKTNYVTVYPRPTPGAKRAELEYSVLERGEGWTRLLIDLKTGRSHQIRVQLAKIGHSILGDTKYGTKITSTPTIQLRAVELSVDHPRTQERLSWSIRKS